MLRELKKVDPELRKKIPDRFKTEAAPLLTDAKALIPTRPTSGWSTGGRLGFKPGIVRRSIRFRFKGTRGRSRGTFSVLTLTTGKSAAASLYEIAGRKSSGQTPQGRALIRKLNQTRRAGRAVWESVDRNADWIDGVMKKLTDEIAREISRKTESR